MSNYFEILMNDPDFIFEDADSAYFHFNMAQADVPRSPSESAIEAEKLVKRDGISISAASLLVAKEIELATSPKTGKWVLEEVWI